jgi:hypothetical protein
VLTPTEILQPRAEGVGASNPSDLAVLDRFGVKFLLPHNGRFHLSSSKTKQPSEGSNDAGLLTLRAMLQVIVERN